MSFALATAAQPVFDWSFYVHAVFHPSGQWVTGLWRTVYISVVSQVAGVLVGLFLALARRSHWAALRWLVGGYVWIVRGTPLLVQLVIIFNGLAATNIYRFKDLSIGSFTLLGVIQAAILTLAINESAYMSEIIRASLDAVDIGQTEAAKALGMTPSVTMRTILLPQAAKIVIPPLGNEFNLMMKSTSLLSVIGVQEMFLTAQSINSATFKTFEIFAAAATYYLILTTIWGFIQSYIERRLGNSETPKKKFGMRERMLGRSGIPSIGEGTR